MTKYTKNENSSVGYTARDAYRDETVAGLYNNKRFKSLRGRLGNWLDKRAINLALDYLPQIEGNILDIPCGTGRVTSMITEAGYTAIAADVSLEMINVARNHFAKSSCDILDFVQSDATHLPFPNRKFACVTAIRFMGHIPATTRVKMLRELGRVSQGYIIVDYSVSNPIINFRRWIENSIKTKDWGFKKNWSWESVPKQQLEEEFSAADFQAVRWFPKIHFFSDASIVLLKRKLTLDQ